MTKETIVVKKHKGICGACGRENKKKDYYKRGTGMNTMYQCRCGYMNGISIFQEYKKQNKIKLIFGVPLKQQLKEQGKN